MATLTHPERELVEGGRVTIPSEAGFAEQTSQLGRRWGADAVRNSDGTELDDEVRSLGLKEYSAYFPVRGDNSYIAAHMDECPQMYLMSDRILADPGTSELEIPLMRSYFDQQLKVNLDADPAKYWEVIDRTTGEVVDPKNWRVADGSVWLRNPHPYHEYTASFLAYIIWDPVEMYNHLTNNWGDKEHEIPYDVRHPGTWAYVLKTYRKWLADNPQTDVVRFTTFFYQFSLIFDQLGREKFVDWFGYGATVSPLALDQFEARYGYRLRPEDFVDEGYYNSSFRPPSQHYLDWVDFTSEFVAACAKQMVDMTHAAGKEAMMFLGDQWIGMEPYGPRFADIGLDAVVGSVGDGTTLRMISDIPHLKYTEGRFLPYFFPDSFYDGADPSIEARENWLQARRAILRSPIQRMGYGGYLSLAAKFPKFVDTVAEITDEFRELHQQTRDTKPYSGLKVAVLNAWGKLRSWQAFTVAHALYSKQAYSLYGVLEALSGMAVDVEFISFDDVLANGVPDDVDVVITAGVVDTAFSGGEVWKDPALVTALRAFVARGGGLVGVGEPSATPFQGRYFQLADLFGVDRETSRSLSVDKYPNEPTNSHFITADVSEPFDFGESTSDVFAVDPGTEVLEYSHGELHLAAHQAGKGRAVYVAGLPFSTQNTRLLMRALFWAAGRETEMSHWFASNPACEVNAYPEAGVYSVANSTADKQSTQVQRANGEAETLTLDPYALVWKEI